MKSIPLTHGYSAIVDDEDYELVSKYTWWYAPRRNQKYAETKINGKNVLMHRFLMGLTGPKVDHEDGDGLNNTRQNLRHATYAQNNANQRVLHRTNTSGIRGVSLHKETGKWRAQIKVAGKQIYLGLFTTKEDAMNVYDEAVIATRGEFALTNSMLGRSSAK